MTTVDVVAFIRARLDEEEQTAQAAAAGGGWIYHDLDSVAGGTLYDAEWEIASLRGYRNESYDYASRMPAARHPGYVDADANGAHIARHDPARVLRQVEAMRRTLVRCEEAVLASSPMAVHFAIQTAREMATFWSDHPEYQEGWETKRSREY